MSERRTEPRHFTCYPFHVQKGERGQTGDKEIAIIQDLSASGALLLTIADIGVGTRVKLHLDLGDLPARVVEGRVLRTDRRPEEVSDVWPYSAAVQFEEAQADLLPEIEALERKVKDTA